MASTERMRAAFAVFDTDNDGYMSKAELRAVLARNDGMDPADAEDILEEFDADEDGMLDINEFIEAFECLDEDEVEQIMAVVLSYINKPIKVANKVRKADGRQAAFRTHMVVVAYDYEDCGEYTPEDACGCGPLSCTADAMRLVELAKKCGCSDIAFLCDKPDMEEGEGWLGWPSASRVVEVFDEVGARCQPGDTFVFFFSGHGAQSEGRAKGEADGKNEELCLCQTDGSYDPLIDDVLAACIQRLPEGVRCLSICEYPCQGLNSLD